MAGMKILTGFVPPASPVRPWTGYVQPYTDTPLDREAVGQAVYLNMISKAKNYIYITTPYLVVDVATNTALCNAAKSGGKRKNHHAPYPGQTLRF